MLLAMGMPVFERYAQMAGVQQVKAEMLSKSMKARLHSWILSIDRSRLLAMAWTFHPWDSSCWRRGRC